MESKLIKIRREILVRIAKAYFENNLSEKIDRIPLKMRPKNGTDISRCCIYKDRAMIKYRIMAVLGFGYEDETDELTPLAEYAEMALNKEIEDTHLTILTDLCSACVKTHYHITDACCGCVARPCTTSCAKNAITVINGKAKINPDLCVGCGKCMSECPYQSIIRIPIPCEESCPTGAISKDENGKEKINHDECILCGKCLKACPFGAIAERSQIIKVLQSISKDKSVTALIAPSIAGQFPGTLQQLHTALLSLGFSSVMEVATGAELTAIEETKEFIEKMEAGQPLLTSSCCPAYVLAVKKQLKKLEPFVSHTPSPMIFTGKLAKDKDPETTTVFIGPCLAKRKEAYDSDVIDYTLTYEELGALFVAKNIDVNDCVPTEFVNKAAKEGRLFGISGGVAGAVAHCNNSNIEVKPCLINGYNRKDFKQLAGKLLLQKPGNFIEVMTCEGGCVAGPGTIAKPNISTRSVESFANKSESIYKPEAQAI